MGIKARADRAVQRSRRARRRAHDGADERALITAQQRRSLLACCAYIAYAR